MKSRKRSRRICVFFAALAVFCIYAFNCVDAWAYNGTGTRSDPLNNFSDGDSRSNSSSWVARASSSFPSWDYIYLTVRCNYSSTPQVSYSFDATSFTYLSRIDSVHLGNYYYSLYLILPSYIPSQFILQTVYYYTGNQYSPYITFNDHFPDNIFTPTPPPETPTPSPTPTPAPATPTPSDYNDTQFWNRVSNDANGAWNALTSIYNGIASNTVLRNLAIYLPLFTLILGLLVYALTFGGDD